MDCDPSCVSPHHFKKHYSMMTLGCCMKAIERFGCCIYSSVEAECVFGSRNIVINGFRYSHYRNPAFHQTGSHSKTPISAHNNQRIQMKTVPVPKPFFGTIF